MAYLDQDKLDDSGEYFYAMWFRHKATGKIVRRPDGRPFRFKKRKGKPGDTTVTPPTGNCPPSADTPPKGPDVPAG